MAAPYEPRADLRRRAARDLRRRAVARDRGAAAGAARALRALAAALATEVRDHGAARRCRDVSRDARSDRRGEADDPSRGLHPRRRRDRRSASSKRCSSARRPVSRCACCTTRSVRSGSPTAWFDELRDGGRRGDRLQPDRAVARGAFACRTAIIARSSSSTTGRVHRRAQHRRRVRRARRRREGLARHALPRARSGGAGSVAVVSAHVDRRPAARRIPTPARASEAPPGPGESYARVIENSKRRQRGAFRRAYLHVIKRASESVLIENAYFLPERAVRRQLTRAVQRGVKVSIIVPGHSDVRMVEYAGDYVLRRLAKRGVEILRWQGTMMHAKTAVVDGMWSTIGSYNFDAQSRLQQPRGHRRDPRSGRRHRARRGVRRVARELHALRRGRVAAPTVVPQGRSRGSAIGCAAFCSSAASFRSIAASDSKQSSARNADLRLASKLLYSPREGDMYMTHDLTVRFLGVRGSIATPGMAAGGNTSCIEVVAGDTRIILDAGTGLRTLGNERMASGPRHSTILLSHLHWDHVAGLQFFTPVYVPGHRVEIASGPNGVMSHDAAIRSLFKAPFFPVDFDDLGGAVTTRELQPERQVRDRRHHRDDGQAQSSRSGLRLSPRARRVSRSCTRPIPSTSRASIRR